MEKELGIWGKVEGEDITLQVRGDNFETKPVTMPIKALADVMVRLTKQEIINKE